MYILPMPQKINTKDGVFTIKYNSKIILSKKCGTQEMHYARILKEEIKRYLGFDLQISKGPEEKGHIYLDINSGHYESYTLNIDHTIKIIGGDTNGLLYGVQSLRQIISQYKSILPLCSIEDEPMIKHRGFYHDATRGRIPTLKSLKSLADRASYYKINELQLYIEHSFIFKEFSEVWRDDTPLTPEEILEYDEYCKKLNIELIPSISTFGHLHKLLTTKQYKEYNELAVTGNEEFSFIDRMAHHTIDVSNDESINIVRKMIEEYIPLFTSKKINICADETFDLGKGKNKEIAHKVGTDKLYVDFLNKIFNIIKENNKLPMFWGDIISKTPERIKGLPKDIICLTWGYGPEESDESAEKIYKTGTPQYLCPGVHGWAEFLNINIYGYNNITRMCEYALKYNAIGVLNTDWGDYGHMAFAEASTIGMIYGANFSWNNTKISFEEINEMISLIAYEDRSRSIAGIVSNISVNQGFAWRIMVRYIEALHREDRETAKRLLSEFSDTKVNNEKILADVKDLYSILKDMEESKRYIIYDYLVMAKGIMIFNRVGNVLAKYAE
ncbi:MAG: beta-N-acetylhexosaminidase [Lachnospirales bacterium]